MAETTVKKQKALKRTSVFVPEAKQLFLTIPEICLKAGDPREGQAGRFGKGEEQVDSLWRYKLLAEEINQSAQATMLSEVNIELCLVQGKMKIADGNRTILALEHLFKQFGSDDVKVTVDSELNGRPLKLEHTKNYGVPFPVKVYGEVSQDQFNEIVLRRQRARQEASKPDWYHQGLEILQAYPGEMPEGVFVSRMGPGKIMGFFPQREGKKPAVEKDPKTGKWILNNREAIQSLKRLLRVPRVVREAFLEGIAGVGPKIKARDLSSNLIPFWDEDVAEAEKNGITLTTEMSLDEIETLLPESKLAQKMKEVLVVSPRGKRAKGAYSGKELVGLAKMIQGTRGGFTLVNMIRRLPGHGESIFKSLYDYLVAAEKALGANSPQAAALDAALLAAKNAPETESTEESSDTPDDSDEDSDE